MTTTVKDLIKIKKTILKREPKSGYKTENDHKRCNLSLNSDIDSKMSFGIFIRQNLTFIENFSIGLMYRRPEFKQSIHIIRYNRAHDPRKNIEHCKKPHIHKIKQEQIEQDTIKAPLMDIQLANNYSTFEEGLVAFIKDTNIVNWQEYFPELEQLKLF